MAKTPFKLKSGNRSAFKELGSTSLSFEELSDKIADDVNTVNQNLKDHFDYEGTGQTKWKGEREGKGTMKKDEKGLTKMERDRAELKDRRRNYSGMSKYKADIIRKREARKAERKAKTEPTTSLDAEISTNIHKNVLSPTVGTDRIDKTLDLKETKGGLYKPKTKTSFGEAFAAARKAKKKTFMWDGGEYTTELK